MNKGFLAFLFGLGVSFLFGLGFMYLQEPKAPKNMDVSYLQTGVYQTHDNALKMQSQLTSLDIESYIYQNEDLYYVICAISTKSDEISDFEAVLSENGINYVRKEKQIESEKTIEKITEKLLEALAT